MLLNADAYFANASASTSKSGLMSDGVLSANSLRSFERASKSLLPTPVIALVKLADRSDSCLQLPAVAIDEMPDPELEVVELQRVERGRAPRRRRAHVHPVTLLAQTFPVC